MRPAAASLGASWLATVAVKVTSWSAVVAAVEVVRVVVVATSVYGLMSPMPRAALRSALIGLDRTTVKKVFAATGMVGLIATLMNFGAVSPGCQVSVPLTGV